MEILDVIKDVVIICTGCTCIWATINHQIKSAKFDKEFKDEWEDEA